MKLRNIDERNKSMLGNKEVMAKNISKYMRINNINQEHTKLSKDLKVKYTLYKIG